MQKGEVWFAGFPLEEDPTCILKRPVIVMDENMLGVLSVKVTKHQPRSSDPYDIPILHWAEAGLRLASTARVSKIMLLSKDNFLFPLGRLCAEDINRIDETYLKFLSNVKK